ncbi:MAG: hypothetical protein KTR28_08760 [Micavibrio sp.]|nr:hypothetical protein [Micavibrio sp.]
MPQNATIACEPAVWTQLTNADTTKVTVQNQGMAAVHLKATTGTTAPTDLGGSFRYTKNEGQANILLADLFPGVAGVRLWAYPTDGHAVVSISHA